MSIPLKVVLLPINKWDMIYGGNKVVLAVGLLHWPTSEKHLTPTAQNLIIVFVSNVALTQQFESSIKNV